MIYLNTISYSKPKKQRYITKLKVCWEINVVCIFCDKFKTLERANLRISPSTIKLYSCYEDKWMENMYESSK